MVSKNGAVICFQDNSYEGYSKCIVMLIIGTIVRHMTSNIECADACTGTLLKSIMLTMFDGVHV